MENIISKKYKVEITEIVTSVEKEVENFITSKTLKGKVAVNTRYSNEEVKELFDETYEVREVGKTRTKEREILNQTVDDLNLINVIRAINGI